MLSRLNFSSNRTLPLPWVAILLIYVSDDNRGRDQGRECCNILRIVTFVYAPVCNVDVRGSSIYGQRHNPFDSNC